MLRPLPPSSTIGILGGGQLGRMLTLAAARLGLKCHVYSDRADDPAFEVAASRTTASYEDEQALSAFAKTVDVATCEFENVPATTLAAIAKSTAVYPPPQAFEVAQDRLEEKNFVSALGIAVAPYAKLDGPQDLDAALAKTKLPALIKTRRFGYDGKGQSLVRTRQEAEQTVAVLHGFPAIAERLVGFDREISVLCVRGADGAITFYDPVENVHERGILALSRVPARLSAEQAWQAKEIARKIADALHYVGVLCVEMFHREAEAPSLLVNEIAPRVHNSGHWTVDACAISQFENHVRAICGWPLGSTERHNDAVMTNLIGDAIDKWRELATDPGTILHLYGKSESRPGRKMGHYTRLYPKS